MIGTFSLFIAFLLVLPPPLTGQHRAQPGGGAVQGLRHRGHLPQHQAGQPLPNAVKALCANLTDPVKLSVTNALKEPLSIDACITLVGPGCAKICLLSPLNKGQTKNLVVGSACSPTK